MRKALAGACIALACWVAGSPAARSQNSAGDNRVAFFETHNILNSGLLGTHTVALTFDDGPNKYTDAVLAALAEQHVKATFFIVGRMARAHPDVLARIADQGHLLANHSATHPLLGRRFVNHPELLLDQVRQVDDEIAPLEPRAKFYFRAPYGSWRSQHAETLNADPILRKYVGPIYWDEGGQVSLSADDYVLSSADWDCWHRGWDAAICAKGYLREIRRKNGGVVLMHCIHAQSAALVEAVVPVLRQEGYRFIRLDQVREYQRYEEPSTASAPALRPQLRS